MRRILVICMVGIYAVIYFSSCEREEITSNSLLYFREDTFILDTMLIQKGGVVDSQVKLYNNNSKATSDIILTLAKGENSPFKMNVNGSAGYYHDNVRINGKDSLYIFLQVPSSGYLESGDEFIEETDTLKAISGGNIEYTVIKVVKVNSIERAGVVSDNIWKGHVYISKDVTIPAGHTLNIEEGCQVYFNDTASLSVKGTLNAIGDCNEAIKFGTYRFDKLTSSIAYSQVPNHWKGIDFLEGSANNQLVHCIINNADTGIYVMSDLQLNKCILQYNGKANLVCSRAKVDISTSLLSNAMSQVKVEDSEINIDYCTIANYNEWNGSDRGYGLEVLSDATSNTITISNTIIYGPHLSETNLDKEGFLNYNITSSLIKTDFDIEGVLNLKPEFVSINESFKFDFHLKSSSPCIDQIEIENTDITDLDCTKRAGKFDIGAFEYFPEDN